jgi:hypothetical protein
MAENTQSDTPASLDNYAGQAGTFINDPLTGTRIPIEKYQPVETIQPAVILPALKPEKTPPIIEDKI